MKKLRVLFTSHSSVVDVYQDKLRHIARHPVIELTVLLPSSYMEGSRIVDAYKGNSEYNVVTLDTVAGNQGKQNRFFFKGLGRVLKEVQPDIIHVEEEPESLVSAQIIRKSRTLHPRPKIIGFTWRNMKFPLENLQWWNPKRLILSAVQRYTLGKFDMIIGGSHHSEEFVRANGYQGQMPLIPQYGVNPDVYFPNSQYPEHSNQFNIGFVGRVLQMKGLHVLVRALHMMPSHCTLTILGTGDYLQQIELLVRELKLESRVKFLRGVPANKVPDIMRSFNVLCIPSLTSPLWREQFGRVIIEAMACGIPVVGSDSGEIPYVIADAGLVAHENDVKALSETLLSLESNPERCLKLRQLGIHRVSNTYTNEIIANNIVMQYKKVMGQE